MDSGSRLRGYTAPTAESRQILLLPEAPPPRETGTRSVTQPTALCVDSDVTTRAMLQSALRGYHVVFASGAYEALRNFNISAFDLYLLEYWLPDWLGVSLCREIRKADPHVPICFYTSAAQSEHRERAGRAGASFYFDKPADPDVLKGEISILMQVRAHRNEAARVAASVAIRQELPRRLASLSEGTSPCAVEKALKRSLETMARRVFVDTKGTLAGFVRCWELLWTDAWRASS